MRSRDFFVDGTLIQGDLAFASLRVNRWTTSPSWSGMDRSGGWVVRVHAEHE
ncbi:hypothetical protein BDR05DRAFT_967075 [Suillus weaverae]|nr:hypothetical protein BDR05DRAFT_967075 [Suillus weaverae]